MRTYIVFYDPQCPFCAWCRDWLERRSCLAEITFVDCESELARRTFAGTNVALGRKLVVTSNYGEVFEGPAAFHVVLSFLTDWCELGELVRVPGVRFFADVVFELIEQNRTALGWFLRLPSCEGHCDVAPAVAGSAYR